MRSPFLQTLRLGLKSLLLQKMRSALAALGIFIGTTTVIWLVAMGEGVSHDAQQQIMELGATNIIVRSVEPQSLATANPNASRLTGCCEPTIAGFSPTFPPSRVPYRFGK